MKCILVVAPHPDDELLVAGGLLCKYAFSEEYKIYIMYVTNGDYYPSEIGVRLEEALSALAVLGINEEYAIFLGFGDSWQQKHIYHAEPDNVRSSHAGIRQTYGLTNHQDFRYRRDGHHSQYTRNNLKRDMSDAIMDLMPEIIIAADFDSHPDHRAVSLIFEECMGDILKINRGYTPLVLKKFAYENILFGQADYYTHSATLNAHGEFTGNPYFLWSDRIQLSLPDNCRTKWIQKNPLYKASKKYKSQLIWYDSLRFINDDICFWRRHTENLAFRAEVSASSGDVKYLNDFKLFDVADIEESIPEFVKTASWTPETDDMNKCIIFYFAEAVTISRIDIYIDFMKTGRVLDACIRINDTIDMHTGQFSQDAKQMFCFSRVRDVYKVEFQILSYEGDLPGITEFEIYDKIIPIKQYDNALQIYHEDKKINSSALSYFEKFLLYLKHVLFIELFPNSMYMRVVYYKILNRYPNALPLCRIHRVLYYFRKKLSGT